MGREVALRQANFERVIDELTVDPALSGRNSEFKEL